MHNLHIGIPDVLFLLTLIGVTGWTARRFPLSIRVARYALAGAAGLLFAVVAFNLATTFRAAHWARTDRRQTPCTDKNQTCTN